MDASRPETATQIVDSRQAVKNVSESQNEYCDTTAEADLTLGGFHQRGHSMPVDNQLWTLVEAQKSGCQEVVEIYYVTNRRCPRQGRVPVG